MVDLASVVLVLSLVVVMICRIGFKRGNRRGLRYDLLETRENTDGRQIYL